MGPLKTSGNLEGAIKSVKESWGGGASNLSSLGKGISSAQKGSVMIIV